MKKTNVRRSSTGFLFAIIFLLMTIALVFAIWNFSLQQMLMERTPVSSSGERVIIQPSTDLPLIQQVVNKTDNGPKSYLEGAVSVPIVAVSSMGGGEVEYANVEMLPGNNQVLVNTNPYLSPDLQYSANKAVAVAERMTGKGTDKNFVFNFVTSQAQMIGGESAGAALTAAVIALTEGKQLRNDTVITGTINLDGSIGQVSGLMDKAEAVAEEGYEIMLVPYGQATIITYKPLVVNDTIGNAQVTRITRVQEKINLARTAKERWGLQIVEVSNIDDAMPYLFR